MQLRSRVCMSGLVSLATLTSFNLVATANDYVTGVVFLDRNENGSRDRGERGIPGVAVSNGREVTKTDRRGRYRLPIEPENVVFVTQPTGYSVPLDENNLPQFFYIHYPDGTPNVAAFNFPVIEPTGALPESVDFPLLRERNRRDRWGRKGRWEGKGRRDHRGWWGEDGHKGRGVKRFTALAFADPQAGSLSQRLDPLLPPNLGNQQLSFLRKDFVDELTDVDADFVMVAGDVINDDLDLYPRHNRIMSALGIPVWNVPGNHDLNFKSPNQRYSTQTFIRTFGPDYYSFDYGDVHFVAMNNVYYLGNADPFGEGNGSPRRFDPGLPDGGAAYRGQVPETQLEWLANDLAHVPEDKLVVVFMHIPLKTLAISGQNTIGAGNINTVNLDELLAVLDETPHVYSFSGHDTSNSWRLQLGEEEGRSPYLEPVEHQVLAEVRGGGWSGPFDERGVRASDMSDGSPNGYYFFDFDGHTVSTRYQAASKPVNLQMRISVGYYPDRSAIVDPSVPCPSPIEAPAGDPNFVFANVFDGGARNEVSLSLDGGAYKPMEHLIRTEDVDTPVGARPAGTGWCNDPFQTQNLLRLLGFLAEINVDLGNLPTEASRIIPAGPQPSAHLWAAPIPADLAPGVHTVRVRSVDQFGQLAEGAKVFEVCPEDFDSIEVGQVLGRDCVVLTAP